MRGSPRSRKDRLRVLCLSRLFNSLRAHQRLTLPWAPSVVAGRGQLVPYISYGSSSTICWRTHLSKLLRNWRLAECSLSANLSSKGRRLWGFWKEVMRIFQIRQWKPTPHQISYSFQLSWLYWLTLTANIHTYSHTKLKPQDYDLSTSFLAKIPASIMRW